LTAFELPASDPAHDHWVTASPTGRSGDVHRLSPFDPLVRQAVADIYHDLSTYAAFQGLLFSDDATLNDFEDASPSALATYREWGLPADVEAIRADQGLRRQWSEKKVRYLTQFSLELAQMVRADHDNLLTARNIFAKAATDAAAVEWFGQSLPDALASYDRVALMAMPYLEDQRQDPQQWLQRLVGVVSALPQGLAKTVFELQSVDWAQRNAPIDAATLAAQLETVRRAGAHHFGYYPDDFLNGRPALEALRPELSLKAFPGND
jgi:biofilm PGA synthesis lipoprotein PgaB